MITVCAGILLKCSTTKNAIPDSRLLMLNTDAKAVPVLTQQRELCRRVKISD